MAAFMTMMFVGMFENWWDRNLLPGPRDWLYSDAAVLPMVLFVGLGFARIRWLQLVGGIGLMAAQSYFLFTYVLTA